MNQEPSAQVPQEQTPAEKPATASKASVVKFVTMLVFVMLFVEAICFPLLMLAIDGPDQTVMSETSVEVQPLTFENYWSGEFASSFDGWFSMRYPLRSDVVGTYRLMSIGYDSLGGNSSDEEMNQPDLDTTNLEIQTDDSGEAVIIFPGRSTETAAQTGMSESGRETMNDPETGTVEPGSETELQTERETTLEEFYLDYEHNIYATINGWQLSQKITEPTGYKGSGVLIGKSGYLYEPAYIDEYLGYSSTYVTTAAGLQSTVDKLCYIQEQLNKRGIGFVFCISSSKASQYADYIPDWYKNQHTSIQGYVRAYDLLMPILENSNLNFVDAKTQYERAGLVVTYAKTGIHWNKLATAETLIQCIKQLSAQMNYPTRNVAFDNLIAKSSPISGGNPDDDIFNILWNKEESKAFVSQQIRDKYYFAPDAYVANPEAPRRNILFQGGSFVHSLVYYWRNYIGECKQIYYNDSIGDYVNGTGQNPLKNGNECWEDLLSNIDYVLFEATEQQLAYLGNNTGHVLMYNSLYEYLKAHEIK